MTSNLLFRFKWHFAKSKNVKIVHYRHQQKNFFHFFRPKVSKVFFEKDFFLKFRFYFRNKFYRFKVSFRFLLSAKKINFFF